MKIEFEDKSYIEVRRIENTNKILICIQAINHNNGLKKIINTVEITEEEFKNLISEI